MNLITMHNWGRAIAHIDADAFFVSVEQALHPELKGKPVVTGAERGIVAALSYEARAAGVKRGMPVFEAKRVCPESIILPSDYEMYSIFSERIFSILRRFSPQVEEYSIDEAFADLTGLRRLHKASYALIAQKMQKAIEKELGITVSVGVSLTKSLAKLCSKFKKPAGMTVVPGRLLHKFLPKIPIEDVWGIGPNTTALLHKHGVKTAYDFVKRPLPFAEKVIGKTGKEMWLELRGEIVCPVNKKVKETYASISKTRTFTPPSYEPIYIFAEAMRNLESACIKARRHNLAAQKLTLLLKRADFRHDAAEAKLSYPTASPMTLSEVLKELFAKSIKVGRTYRATGVILSGLTSSTKAQLPLFGDTLKIVELEKVGTAIDEINTRFGKHTIFIANGLYLKRQKREPHRQNLSIPNLGAHS